VRQLEFINYLVRLRVAELESDDKTGVQHEVGLGLQFTADQPNASNPSSSSNSANASPPFSFLNQELGAPPPPDCVEPHPGAAQAVLLVEPRRQRPLCMARFAP